MRICLVSYEFPPSGGGEASYTRALATAFSRDGHDVTVIAPSADRTSAIEGDRFDILRARNSGPLRGASFLAGAELALDGLARNMRPDIVHVTFDYPTFLFHLRQRGIPSIATVHHLHMAEALSMASLGVGDRIPRLLKASILSALEGRLLGQCDTVLAVSRFTAATAERYLGIEKERLRVVMNGIDSSRFEDGDGDVFRRAFPGVSGKAVLYVGRLSESKGVDLLVEAFAKTKEREPKASLVLVGSGAASYVRRLMARTASLRMSGSVVFTGRIPDQMLPHAYAASAMTVLPSYMEGFGISILESMASARPSIAARVGGVPEVLIHGKTGLLVGPGDAEQLSDAMRALLEDSELAGRMGLEGRRVARERFTLEMMAKGTMDAYQETIRAIAGRRNP